jgi:catechol 2,3-dioxygenase-like lactoylglutathione lyase family enzyme
MNGKGESKVSNRSFKLEVPLSAPAIEGVKPDLNVKVAVQNQQGAIQAQIVKFDENGKGVAKFAFAERPGKLGVAVGPPGATDQELFGLQTLRVDVPARLWKDPQVVFPPIPIPPYYWYWWWRWCRDFTVRGRVVCPDGRPVPGAKVCAFDVDAWWWWSSKQLVGCDTTDATGSFEIKFRWCCGWWPWWWWRMRTWYLEPFLLERILPVLEREPQLRPIPLPDPIPDLHVFEHLVGGEQFAALNLTRHLAVKPATSSIEAGAAPDAVVAAAGVVTQASLLVNPDVLADLREPLVARLPRVPELEQLHIWPWWPWQPWSDCTPDIIFRVTQDCVQAGTVIVEEGYGQARWNIPTSLDVTLVANNQACCLEDPPGDPEGTCALLTNVCWDSINAIGGNPGAPAAPVGYLNPGDVSIGGDRPYGGNVLIQGQVGNDVEYYDFQRSDDDGATWNDMPGAAVGDVPRQFWIPLTNTFVWVPSLDTIDGRLVFESRQHYEATHDPGTWGLTRFWMAANYLSLMNWLTQTPFINGRYRVRIRGWKLVGGTLAEQQKPGTGLLTCSTLTPAELVLRIDNRLEGAASGHPMADPNHPCGGGTVHTCTLEPDTDFLDVRIVRRDANGVPTGVIIQVGACGNVPIGPQDLLQVDFFAHDPEGHLAYYTLQATYKENLARNLLTLPGMTLTPLGSAPVPAAAQVGPSYAQARSVNPPPAGGAAAPTWHGGAIRLEVLAQLAFPETCCYQLELRAHKRTVVSCYHGFWGHTNYSEYSFMIVV